MNKPKRDDRTTFTAWITKYALTNGIKKCEVEDCFDTSPDYVKDRTAQWGGGYHRKDWHRTREAAVARAEEMRLAKIKSLRKSLEKFEAMRFV